MKVVSMQDVAVSARRLMEDEDFQILLGHLINKFGFVDKSLLSKEPIEMAAREGGRMVLIEINRVATLPPGSDNQPATIHEEVTDDQDYDPSGFA